MGSNGPRTLSQTAHSVESTWRLPVEQSCPLHYPPHNRHSRGIVIGVNNCLYQRALAIGYDVRIVCRDCDRGRCRHS